MPRVKKRTPRPRKGYSSGHIFQLLTGQDFFGDGFGNGPEAEAAMREAWSDPEVRDRVYVEFKRRQGSGLRRAVPWAEDNLGGK